MWPPGHLAVGYLVYRGILAVDDGRRPAPLPVVVLGFATLLPDLVDKPLAWYLGLLATGRSLGHSALVLSGVGVVSYVVLRRDGREEIAVGFTVGALSHVLVDAVPSLWDPTNTYRFLLWPVQTVPPSGGGTPTLTSVFFDAVTEPYFLGQFLLFGLAVALWRSDGYPGMPRALRTRT